MNYWEKRKYLKEQLAVIEAEEAKKKRLLEKEMDYAFLEEIIQKMNENPLLRVKITLNDGTTLDLNTTPKKRPIEYLEPHEDFIEVK